jgi:hypothetical protein
MKGEPLLMRQRITSVAWLASTALASAPTLAQENPAYVARLDLIAQAEAAATAGDHAQALRFAERAAQLHVTPTLQYFLAREHLALDHPVEALGYSRACARAAEADLALRNRDVVLEACRAIVASTERRVGRITVQVPSPALPGLAVRVQQVELPATLYGVPYPVVPGAVVVEASAPGRLPFRREVQVTASETSSVDVHLDAAPVVVATPIVVAPRVRAAPPVEAPSRGVGVGPWIVAGTGAAVMVLGGVFYGRALNERSDRDAACDHGVDCRPEAQTHDERYASYLTATNIALGVGAAAVAGGATWFLVSRLSRREAQHAALRWNVSPSASGLTLGLGGRF